MRKHFPLLADLGVKNQKERLGAREMNEYDDIIEIVVLRLVDHIRDIEIYGFKL